jgi:predicted KAP-like P-loop ATPase
MFLSDHETATDLLYYEIISTAVVSLILKAGEQPISIGVHGDWGAGKSSILKMTEAAVKSDDVICIWFNGWQFQGFDDAKTVLIERILGELEKNQRVLEKAKAELVSLAERVRVFKVARLLGSVALAAHGGWLTMLPLLLGREKEDGKESESGTLGGLLDPKKAKTMPKEIDAFHKEFEALLNKADIRRMVVLLDDLDRCLPTPAIETLEAIKLFLFVPRAVFVIGADETMIEYAVRKHFPDLPLGQGAQTYARNYLEKLIQVPFRIPAMGLVETRVYVALLYLEATSSADHPHFKALREVAREVLRKPWKGELFDRAILRKQLVVDKLPDDVERAITLSNQLAPLLTDQTKGNPRQVKRFLNAMFLRQTIADARGLASEIKTPVLAKIMLVERFFEPFYEALSAEVMSSSNGIVDLLKALEEGEDVPDTRHRDKKDGSAWESAISEEIRMWAKQSPPISGEDLRPYILITRDRRRSFAAASTDHDALIEKLMSGSGLAVAGSNKELQALPAAGARAVFDEICARIRMHEQYEQIPPGAVGLAAIASAHPELEESLLSFAESLPTEKIGPWILAEAKWASAIRDTTLHKKWEELVVRWAEQTENAALSAVAKGLSKLKKSPKPRS